MKWPRRFFAPRVRTSKVPGPRRQLSLEPLEDRLAPAVTPHGGAVLPHVEAQGVYLGSDWNSTADLRHQNDKPMYPTEEVYSSDGSMTVAANANGRLEVFAIGRDHVLYHRWQLAPNGGWSGWASLGGLIVS
jgi:hypothetical protein